MNLYLNNAQNYTKISIFAKTFYEKTMIERTKEWKEAELMLHFQLTKIVAEPTALMKEWFDVEQPLFDAYQQRLFDESLSEAQENIGGWSEEDLKMYFISNVLRLSGLMSQQNKGYVGVFEKKLSAVVNNTRLTVRTDFLVAKGFKNIVESHYFHFQEYKPQLNPTGEPMAQLIEAFLIGQAKNEKVTPLYGCEVIGKQWTFVTMEGKNYCVSEAFDCTKRESLLKIIAILRKFKYILETRLLNL